MQRGRFPVGAVDRLVCSPVNYWAAMAADLGAALVFLVVGFDRFAGRRTVAVGLVLAGVATWGLVEYVLHRWVLHGPFPTIRRGHRQHHAMPRELIAVPFLVMAIAALGIWRLLALLMSAAAAALLVGGLYVGYNYYACIHHAQHQYGQRLVTVGHWGRLTRFHQVHHGLPHVNFGITTTVWDRIFGTYRASEEEESSGRLGRTKGSRRAHAGISVR